MKPLNKLIRNICVVHLKTIIEQNYVNVNNVFILIKNNKKG